MDTSLDYQTLVLAQDFEEACTCESCHRKCTVIFHRTEGLRIEVAAGSEASHPGPETDQAADRRVTVNRPFVFEGVNLRMVHQVTINPEPLQPSLACSRHPCLGCAP